MSGKKGMKGQKWSDERKAKWKEKRYPNKAVQEVKDAIPETVKENI